MILALVDIRMGVLLRFFLGFFNVLIKYFSNNQHYHLQSQHYRQ